MPKYPQNAVNKADQPGDPVKAGRILLAATDSEHPPFGLLLGKMVVDFALNEYEQRIRELNQWKEPWFSADYDDE